MYMRMHMHNYVIFNYYKCVMLKFHAEVAQFIVMLYFLFQLQALADPNNLRPFGVEFNDN